MRRTVSRENETWGEAFPDEGQTSQSRNVNADIVGYLHASEVDYDDIGHEEITSGTTLKIETTPGGQELYSGNVDVGDVVYWGIKRANE